MVGLLLAAVLSADPGSGDAAVQAPLLAVLDLNAGEGVTTQLAEAVTDSVTAQVAARGGFRVISAKEVRTMIGQERQRQLMGCSEGDSCTAEIAGAVGARFALSGTLAKLGTSYQLSLQTVDSVKATVIGRTTRLAKDLDELRLAIPYAVAEATATPLPEPPSKVVPYSISIAGAAALIFGGLAGIDAISRDRALAQELETGERRPGLLRSRQEYEEETRFVGTERTVALISMGVGAALVGTGLYLAIDRSPRAKEIDVRAQLTPNSAGVVISGVFP